MNWYCDVCVARSWHTMPPSLTPPASPQLLPLPGTGQRHVLVSSRLPAHRNPPPHLNDEGSQGQGHTSSVLSTGPSQEPNLTRRSENIGSASREQVTCSPPPGTNRTEAGFSSLAETPSEESRQSLSKKKTSSRRSRYSTLPTEVDSALRVLYSEIEATMDLRKRVADLEAETSQQRRELHIRDSELAVAHKALETTRSSQNEITRLQRELSERQQAFDTAIALETKTQNLETELQSTRTQLSEMTRAYQGLKQKLSALLDS